MDLQTELFDRLSRNEVDQAVVAVFAEDGSFTFPHLSVMKGHRAIGRVFRMIRNRFQEIHWKTEPEIFAEPDLIVSRWIVWGTFKTMKKYENSGVSIIRLTPEGKISSLKDYFHSTDFSDT